MALHELHARRMATVINLIEGALDRFELVLKGIEHNRHEANAQSQFSVAQAKEIRRAMERIRERLKQAGDRFHIQRTKPEPRQVLAAELSTLWVVLENAMPKRMKGYGRELAPEDKSDWENLVQALLGEVDQVREIILEKNRQD